MQKLERTAEVTGRSLEWRNPLDDELSRAKALVMPTFTQVSSRLFRTASPRLSRRLSRRRSSGVEPEKPQPL